MEKTAIEWLVEQLSNYDSKMIELFNNEIEQAKEIEKKQITDAYKVGKFEAKLPIEEQTTGKQYYKETFKQD